MTKINFERQFVDMITSTNPSFSNRCARCLLHPLSWGYSAAVSFRNWAFDNGLFEQIPPPVPMVISVGNIVAGGGGKTPIVLTLAQELSACGRIAVLSRGYRSLAEHANQPIIVDDSTQTSICGDEPRLLADNLPDAMIIVGKNRCESAQLAAKHGADIIILDDGMQHRQLGRHCEVVVMRGNDPFGLGYCLPRGLLREKLNSLKRANFLIIHGQLNEWNEAILRKYTSAPIITTDLKVTHLIDLNNQPINSIADEKVALFAGIANPSQFESTVQKLGCHILDKMYVSDHRAINPVDLQAYANRCRTLGAKYLLCTEKDRVKLDDNLNISLSILWVKTKISIASGRKHWQQLIKSSMKNVQHHS